MSILFCCGLCCYLIDKRDKMEPVYALVTSGSLTIIASTLRLFFFFLKRHIRDSWIEKNAITAFVSSLIISYTHVWFSFIGNNIGMILSSENLALSET